MTGAGFGGALTTGTGFSTDAFGGSTCLVTGMAGGFGTCVGTGV
jgi:hypothetical protein